MREGFMDRIVFEAISLKCFLRLPRAKPPLEYIGGNAVQKYGGTVSHGVVQMELAAALHEYAERHDLGRTYFPLRCTFGGRSLVPDVCVFARDRDPVEDDVTTAPDLWIEVHSRGESVRGLARRLRWCLARGSRLAWLVHPKRQRVYVFEPGAPHRVLGRGDDLDGGAVLPGFRMALAGLFDELKRP
jgi:Uma2 family endonuclease